MLSVSMFIMLDAMLAVFLVGFEAASLDVRIGVDPAVYHRYSGDGFQCLGGEGPIPIGRVNDDYCDCPVFGDDEPGTSACAEGSFYCHNPGARPKRIESWRVNDGIPDCCDGSDEYSGLSSIQSTCAEIGRAEKYALVRRRTAIQQGLDVKAELIQAGIEVKKTQDQRRLELGAQIEAKTLAIARLRQSKDEAETIERTEREKENDRNALEVPATVEQTKDEEETQESSQGIQSEQESGEERTRLQEELSEPSFSYPEQDAVPKKTGPDDGEKDSEPTSPESFPYPEQYAFQKQPEKSPADTEKVEDWQGRDGDDEPDEDPELAEAMHPPPESESPTVRAANDARKALSSAEEELSALQAELTRIEALQNMDFGPDNAYLALQTESFTLVQDKYTYKLSPFKVALQIESGSTSLGNFQGWENGYSEWNFDHGQRCWNGPERSTKVKLVCGLEHKLLGVNEPSTCHYEMRFQTPAACSQEDVDKINASLSEFTPEKVEQEQEAPIHEEL